MAVHSICCEAVRIETRTVTVCIATCHRQRLLQRLIESIGRCELPLGTEVRMMVVDNAPTPEVDEVDLASRSPLALRVVHEPERGIPFARNRALREAMPSDVIVFVDDDEVVDRRWLVAHLDAMERYGADVTIGPVVSSFPAGTPSWAASSGVFDRRRSPTGTNRTTAATGNTAVRGEVFERVRPWFAEELRFTGGSDTEYFSRVHVEGHSIVWVDDAVATEEVSTDRLTVSWVLRRNYRIGTGIARRWETHDPRRRMLRVARQLARAMKHVLLGSSFVIWRRGHAVHHAAEAAQAIGRVMGHFGGSYDEYSPDRIDRPT